MAERVFSDTIQLEDGTIVKAKAWSVPKNPDYPEGVKYSFQHYDPETRKTLLRFDNYNRHSGSRHHIHRKDGSTEPARFEDLEEHYRKFLKEVKNE